MKQTLPNAVAVLVLGICSIVFNCLYGLGLILGIVGLVLSSAPMKLYRANPQEWDGYSMLNAGRIMSIIGIVLGGIIVLIIVIAAIIIGAAGVAASTFPWESFL